YLFAGYLIAQAVFVPVGFHIFGTRLQGDLRTVSLVARDLNVPVSMFGVFMPSSMFYAGKAINTFFVIEQVKPHKSSSSNSEAGEALLIRDLDLGKFNTVEGLTLTPLSKAGE
ncbi:MAG: hypothetical protein K8F91_05930, partial [Candidatus Obscuribacterales bacterium]|nr:hypothetical protein [Candidatus Obscuribacterales bacterium]